MERSVEHCSVRGIGGLGAGCGWTRRSGEGGLRSEIGVPIAIVLWDELEGIVRLECARRMTRWVKWATLEVSCVVMLVPLQQWKADHHHQPGWNHSNPAR